MHDDLFSLHAELTADVLRAGDAREQADAQARLDARIGANRPLVERCLGILNDIRAGGSYDLTTLPVALRELRNLIHAAAAVAAVDYGAPASASRTGRGSGRAAFSSSSAAPSPRYRIARRAASRTAALREKGRRRARTPLLTEALQRAHVARGERVAE